MTAFALALFWLVSKRAHYTQLQHQSPEYYAGLAAALDSLFPKQPLALNECMWPPLTDPSLPKVLRDLHPLKIQVNAHDVWMALDSNSGVHGLVWWRPQEWDTNIWNLEITRGYSNTVLYSARR